MNSGIMEIKRKYSFEEHNLCDKQDSHVPVALGYSDLPSK